MRSSILLLLSVALACTSAVAAGRPNQPLQDTREELVWSRLLTEIAGDNHRSLVVSDSAYLVTPDSLWGRLLLEEFSGLREETVQSFREANAVARAMPRFTGLNVPLEHASRSELAVLRHDRNPDEYWRAFYGRYPNSLGLVQLSRAGFDPSQEQALVYVHHSCGGRCGTGKYVLLSKSREQWQVIDEYIALAH